MSSCYSEMGGWSVYLLLFEEGLVVELACGGFHVYEEGLHAIRVSCVICTGTWDGLTRTLSMDSPLPASWHSARWAAPWLFLTGPTRPPRAPTPPDSKSKVGFELEGDVGMTRWMGTGVKPAARTRSWR